MGISKPNFLRYCSMKLRVIIFLLLLGGLNAACERECEQCTVTETTVVNGRTFDADVFESQARYCDDELEEWKSQSGSVQVDSSDPTRVIRRTLSVVCVEDTTD